MDWSIQEHKDFGLIQDRSRYSLSDCRLAQGLGTGQMAGSQGSCRDSQGIVVQGRPFHCSSKLIQGILKGLHMQVPFPAVGMVPCRFPLGSSSSSNVQSASHDKEEENERRDDNVRN